MENTRSLKILNNYFDAVSQNELTEPQELIFNMAEKQNTKARKLLPFTIKVKKNFLDTITTMKKRSSKKESEQLALRASIFSAQMQSEYDNFLKNTNQQRRQANMPLIKPRQY